MPEYICKSVTKNGQIVKSKMFEIDEICCLKRIKESGLNPISIKPVNKLLNLRKIGNHISKNDIIVFTQDLYLLKKAKFNNIKALEVIIENIKNKYFKSILEKMLDDIKSGQCIYQTMEMYPDVFSYMYVNMIKVGELSGSLEKSLNQAVTYLDKTEKFRSKMIKILLPNLVMFIGILLMLILCVIIGVPLIQNLFESIGSKDELPAITIWFSNFINNIIDNKFSILFSIFVFIVLLRIFISTNIGKRKLDYFKYKMPIFGKLWFKVDFSQFLRCFLINIENGSKIQDALDISKNVIKNTLFLDVIDKSIDNLFKGKSWIEPFEKFEFCNKISIEMLNIGMKTDFVEMCGKLLEYVENDIDNLLVKITKIMPEVSYAIVGVAIIFFVIVVLVPCLEVYMGGFIFSAYGF